MYEWPASTTSAQSSGVPARGVVVESKGDGAYTLRHGPAVHKVRLRQLYPVSICLFRTNDSIVAGKFKLFKNHLVRVSLQSNGCVRGFGQDQVGLVWVALQRGQWFVHLGDDGEPSPTLTSASSSKKLLVQMAFSPSQLTTNPFSIGRRNASSPKSTQLYNSDPMYVVLSREDRAIQFGMIWQLASVSDSLGEDKAKPALIVCAPLSMISVAAARLLFEAAVAAAAALLAADVRAMAANRRG